MRDDVYTLPLIQFVAGQTILFSWDFYDSTGESFDCSECFGSLAVVEYDDKSGEAMFSKDLTFSSSSASLTLAPKDSLDWGGKYVYQITIADSFGLTEIPNKGIMFVSNNINQSYLQAWIDEGYETGYRLRLISDMTSAVSSYCSDTIYDVFYIET